MRIFERFPTDSKQKCPICGTKKQAQCVLIPVDGTKDGGMMIAKCFHLECIELRLGKLGRDGDNVIYQIFDYEN